MFSTYSAEYAEYLILSILKPNYPSQYHSVNFLRICKVLLLLWCRWSQSKIMVKAFAYFSIVLNLPIFLKLIPHEIGASTVHIIYVYIYIYNTNTTYPFEIIFEAQRCTTARKHPSFYINQVCRIVVGVLGVCRFNGSWSVAVPPISDQARWLWRQIGVSGYAVVILLSCKLTQ